MTWKRWEPMPKNRRLRILKISYAVFLTLVMPDGKSLVRQTGLPKDSRMVAMYDEPETGCICLCIASSKFSPVPEGQYPETICPLYERAWKRGWWPEDQRAYREEG